IITPEAVTGAGFQMSFAATIALIISYGPWSRLAPHLPWWIKPVAMLIVSSLVAALATSPIAAAHFNRMSQYGLLANLLAVPVMGTLVMPAGVIGAILALVGAEAPALWVMGIGTKWMLLVAEFVAGLGGSVMAVSKPPAAVIPMMEFGAVLAILCWRSRGQRRPVLNVGLAGGMAMMIAAGGQWATAHRPLILIAPEGEAVGLMTPQGRAVSKPAGGAFVISSWLQEDGDMETQEISAMRPAWQGDKRDHWADLPDGWQLWHLTGKGSGDRALVACTAKRIVVVSEKVQAPDRLPCMFFDPASLRKTGAVAIGFQDGRPVWQESDVMRLHAR
ncbi:MAG: ComEC/Rec2 family competence protein, partial [Paracoccus sp. (in: a-proteobacteria)]|nr:ComEC/Rec2 family competence protein [Paracoccus sp. (in: a-proteobacteria)]